MILAGERTGGISGLTAESVNDTAPAGASWGRFSNEQIVHVLLDEMTAVHGVLRNLKLEESANDPFGA